MTSAIAIHHPGASLESHYRFAARLLDEWGENEAADQALALLEHWAEPPENPPSRFEAEDSRLAVERALSAERAPAEPLRIAAALLAASDVALLSAVSVPARALSRMRWLAELGHPYFRPAMAQELAALWRLDRDEPVLPVPPPADVLADAMCAFVAALPRKSRIATSRPLPLPALDTIMARTALLCARDRQYDALLLPGWLASFPEGAITLGLTEIGRVLRPEGSAFFGLPRGCSRALFFTLCRENGFECLYFGEADSELPGIGIVRLCRAN